MALKEMPDLPGQHRTYPNTGGSVMLPLTKENNYEVEIMMCGGGEVDAVWSATEASCGSIKPMSSEPQWQMTHMPGGGRVMVEGVLLLDETVLWLNGARIGCQGFGTAGDPAFEALIYNPKSQSWSVSGQSSIARLYHSVALMLLDGTILVAGSNPNEMPLLNEDVVLGDPIRAYPTEFRVEKYTPSYLLGQKAKLRPTYIDIRETTFVPGETVTTISFKSLHPPKQAKVLLYHGGFVTHAVHMGQVMVEMEHTGVKNLSGDRYKLDAQIPDIKLAPGPYVIYVVIDGVPGVGQFVSIKTA